MRFNKQRESDLEIDIDYRRESYKISARDRIKINGIWFLQDSVEREDVNIQKCVDSMERILAQWSTRHLSLLGRILIVKTFAISQFVYLLQSINVTEQSTKKVMRIIYKFLWNRNFSGNRAPERLKRSIMLTPIQYGGFGMIDLTDISNSLDLRSLGRLLESTHPFLSQIKALINFNDFFNVTTNGNVDRKLKHALLLLNQDRDAIYNWPMEKVKESVSLKRVIQNFKVSTLLTMPGKQSIQYLAIHRRVRNPRVHQLTALEFTAISRFVKERRLINLIKGIIGTPYIGELDSATLEGYPHSNKVIKKISSMSSKDIRLSRTNFGDHMINVYKIGMVLDPGELLSWTKRVKSLTSTRHKNILLRVAHGDVFSNARLHKFGLRDSAGCSNCDERVESIQHRLFDCPKARETWIKFNEAKNSLELTVVNLLTLENILGAGERLDKLDLALQAELLLRLSSKGEGYHPEQVVRSAVSLVFNSERLNDEKMQLFKNWKRSW